jgi:hypothetical protein
MAEKYILTKVGNQVKVAFSDGMYSRTMSPPFNTKLGLKNDVLGFYSVEVKDSIGDKLNLSTDNILTIGGVAPDNSNSNAFFEQVVSFFPEVSILSPSDVDTLITAQIDALKDGVSVENNTLKKIEYNLPITVLFSGSNGQTIFVIGEDIKYSDRNEMYINGVFQRYGADFTVDSNQKQIKYTNTEYNICDGDNIVIKYIKQYN